MAGQHVRLNDKAHAVLTKMYESSRTPRSKLVSEMVLTFDAIARAVEEGGTVHIEKPDGTTQQLIIPSLFTVVPK